MDIKMDGNGNDVLGYEVRDCRAQDTMCEERQHTRSYKGLQGVIWGKVDSCVGMGLGWIVQGCRDV